MKFLHLIPSSRSSTYDGKLVGLGPFLLLVPVNKRNLHMSE
jgi:hypothetical protein